MTAADLSPGLPDGVVYLPEANPVTRRSR